MIDIENVIYSTRFIDSLSSYLSLRELKINPNMPELFDDFQLLSFSLHL